MPREVRPTLQTLINTGRCNWHTTVDIVLTDGTTLFISSGEIYINNFGKTQQYLAKIKPESVQALSMSQDIEVDMIQFRVANVDMIIGRLFTGAVRRMDGASATIGIIFIDPAAPNFNLGTSHIWDAKMRGELVGSDIADDAVDFSLVSILDVLMVSGRTIASEFQWREPVTNVPTINPNDLPLPILPSRGGDTERLPTTGGGRYGDLGPVSPFNLD